MGLKKIKNVYIDDFILKNAHEYIDKDLYQELLKTFKLTAADFTFPAFVKRRQRILANRYSSPTTKKGHCNYIKKDMSVASSIAGQQPEVQDEKIKKRLAKSMYANNFDNKV